MTVSQLDTALTKALQDFSEEIRANYEEGSNEPVTENDINELARQTFYTLDEFRKEIVKYLAQ